MYEKLEACPLCKHTDFQNFLICDDHSVSQESFALVQCKKCSLVFTNPRPLDQHLHKYYESDTYISHTDKGNNLINIIYKLVRRYTLSKKLKLVSKYAGKNKSILDFGCGTGDFLRCCIDDNWEAFGYEPDNKAREIAIKKNPGSAVNDLKKLENKFQVITCWHVLEHVSDLAETIKSLKQLLNDKGYLILALPNHKSYDAAYYKEDWAAYDVPRHLYHFDRQSIKTLSEKYKLKLVKVLPMKFDSFYVSMLSEKYKKGSLLKALKTGYLSNQKASMTKEYSSLIYILRK